MLNPKIRAVLIHLNSADVSSLLAGILPHVPKPKDKAKGKEPGGGAQEDVVYWIGEDADDCVVFASTKPSPSQMTRHAFGSAPIGHKESVLPASKMDTLPVRSLATDCSLAFADRVEGITTTSHMAGKIVALPRQCPLPWVGKGEPPTVGVSASVFTFNEDSSKLDATAHLLWKGVVPMEMLDKVVDALETRPCDTWDAVFNDFAFDKSLESFNPCLTTRRRLMDWLFMKITKSFHQNPDLNSSQHRHVRDKEPTLVGVL